ncbi:MAG: CBS domain-containing protein [Candidatus Marsarchaeota archaeon]|jgi:CBS domain-containing protein|nr:CBS domain-containing protein [Candidatus Marsarchaeota archaeon]
MKIAFESVPSEFVSETDFYDHKAPLTEALAKINKYGAVVVTKNGEFYGIVDDRSVLKKGTKISNKSAISKFALKVPVLDSNTSIEKAVYQFYGSGAKALPYYENKKITGIVSRKTMLKAILSLHLLSKYKVKDIMSTPLVAIDSDSTVSTAKAVMRQSNIKRLAVISDGKLKGILTNRHILDNASLHSRLPERASEKRREGIVGDIAESGVRSIAQDESADSAMRDMVEGNISSLVVTRSGVPVGIVTIRDLFETVAAGSATTEDKIMISGLDDYTSDFREDITSELQALADRINKFHNISVDSIAFNIKRHRAKNYEMKLRVWLAKQGVVSASAAGFSLEETLKSIVENMYDSIKQRKEIVYMDAKLRKRADLDEE